MTGRPELRVHLEWQAYPTWVATPDGGTDNPDPHDLGVPAGLADDLVAYSDDYDALWDPDDPRARFADASSEQAFYARGRALAVQLAAAVGERWQVQFQGADGGYVDVTPSG